MTNLPSGLGDLFSDPAQFADDVTWARALQNLRVLATNGQAGVRVNGSDNAVLDLRSLVVAAGSSIAITSDIPSVSGNAGKYLVTNGTNAAWVSIPLYDSWVSNVNTAGGTFGSLTKPVAASVAYALSQASYLSKIVYLLPMVGGNLATARVPLIDKLSVGNAVNHGFSDADFSERHGLQGNGSKYLTVPISPNSLGSTGGLGWWETNFTGSGNPEPIGCHDANGGSPDLRFVLDIRSSRGAFIWCDTASGAFAVDGQSGSNAHYYGQKSASNLRTIYKNGANLGNTTIADSSNSSTTFAICGATFFDGSVRGWPGRGGCAYITDGTMTDAEVSAFHSLLSTYLMSPLGR